MKKKLAIIGTKEFAQQIIFYATNTGEFEVIGYFDDLLSKDTIVDGLPVLGKVADAEDYYKDGLYDCIFIGIGYTRFDLREYYYKILKGKVPFANIIQSNVGISKKAQVGEGIFIGKGSTINMGSVIEDNVFIHGDSQIGHDSHIGAHSYISGGLHSAGFVSIGKRVFVGIRVCIADHISICDDAWIGLACIVAKNIKEPGKYMSPAAKLYKIE